MLDINCATMRERGPEMMEWVISTIQEEMEAAICLDSPDADTLEVGLRVARGPVMIKFYHC